MSPRRSLVPPQQMQDGPSQSQIEIEHHKNLLIGLNEKLTVFNDLKHDLETQKQQTAESEEKRQELQQVINAASV